MAVCEFDQTKITRCDAEIYKYSVGYGSGCIARQGERMCLLVKIQNKWTSPLRLFIWAWDAIGNQIINLETPDQVAPNEWRQADYFFDQPNYDKGFNIRAGWIQD